MHIDRHLVNLALVGFMGAGKTSVGRIVAEQLHFEFLDTDELIQTRTGRTIALSAFFTPTPSTEQKSSKNSRSTSLGKPISRGVIRPCIGFPSR